MIRNLFLFLLFSTVSSFAESSPLRLLVLIIASDDLPIYEENHKIWRSYMHLDKEHVECYFIKADPMLLEPYRIDQDVIWVRGKENIAPGILNKTLDALEIFWPRIESEFDFVLRTNLSSFFVFPNLLTLLEKYPKHHLYSSGGSTHQYGYTWHSWGHGCGFLLSKDVVKTLVAHKQKLYNRKIYHDDVEIANFLLFEKGYPLFPSDRIDLLSIADWVREEETIPYHAYHFRVKHRDPEQRMAHDLFIYQKLLHRFYPQVRWVYD